MLDVHLSAEDIRNICTGLAMLVGACAPLVWAYRRDPKSSADAPRLPPPAE